MEIDNLIKKLSETHSLSLSEYEYLIENRTEKAAKILREKAVKIRREIYGNTVFVRGIIEISNI